MQCSEGFDYFTTCVSVCSAVRRGSNVTSTEASYSPPRATMLSDSKRGSGCDEFTALLAASTARNSNTPTPQRADVTDAGMSATRTGTLPTAPAAVECGVPAVQSLALGQSVHMGEPDGDCAPLTSPRAGFMPAWAVVTVGPGQAPALAKDPASVHQRGRRAPFAPVERLRPHVRTGGGLCSRRVTGWLRGWRVRMRRPRWWVPIAIYCAIIGVTDFVTAMHAWSQYGSGAIGMLVVVIEIAGFLRLLTPVLLAWHARKHPYGGLERCGLTLAAHVPRIAPLRSVSCDSAHCSQCSHTQRGGWPSREYRVLQSCAVASFAAPAALACVTSAATLAMVHMTVSMGQSLWLAAFLSMTAAAYPLLALSQATLQLGFVLRAADACDAIAACADYWRTKLCEAEEQQCGQLGVESRVQVVPMDLGPLVQRFDDAADVVREVNDENAPVLAVLLSATCINSSLTMLCSLLLPPDRGSQLVYVWGQLVLVAISAASVLVAAAFTTEQHRKLLRIANTAASARGHTHAVTIAQLVRHDDACTCAGSGEAAPTTRCRLPRSDRQPSSSWGRSANIDLLVQRAALSSHVQWHKQRLALRVGPVVVTRGYVTGMVLGVITSLMATLVKEVVVTAAM